MPVYIYFAALCVAVAVPVLVWSLGGMREGAVAKAQPIQPTVARNDLRDLSLEREVAQVVPRDGRLDRLRFGDGAFAHAAERPHQDRNGNGDAECSEIDVDGHLILQSEPDAHDLADRKSV